MPQVEQKPNNPDQKQPIREKGCEVEIQGQLRSEIVSQREQRHFPAEVQAHELSYCEDALERPEFLGALENLIVFAQFWVSNFSEIFEVLFDLFQLRFFCLELNFNLKKYFLFLIE